MFLHLISQKAQLTRTSQFLPGPLCPSQFLPGPLCLSQFLLGPSSLSHDLPILPSLPPTVISVLSSLSGTSHYLSQVSSLFHCLTDVVLNRWGTCCPTATLEWSSSSWAPTPWSPSCSVSSSVRRSPELTWQLPVEELSTLPSTCPMCSVSPGRTTSALEPKLLP